MQSLFRHVSLPLVLLLALVLFGCGGNKSVPTLAPTATRPPRPTVTPTSTATSVPAASPTATPSPVTSQPTASPTAAAQAQLEGIVKGTVVNLRSGPGTGYAVVGMVREGDKLTIVGRSEDSKWWLSGASHEGWIFGDLVELSGTKDAIPVVKIAQPPKPTAMPVQASTDFPLPPKGNFPAPSGNLDPLTGLSVDPAKLQHKPLLVVINNTKVARPQYGLNSADIVYEYMMEGWWVTRLTGIFWSQDAKQIGPVRSARLINHYMTPLYDGALTASGASDKVRYTLKHDPFPYFDIDLDDPGNNRYSWSVGHYWETRVRTSTARVRQWLADQGKDGTPHLRSLTFGADLAGAPATALHIPYPRSSVVDWRYDAGSGCYFRYVLGQPALDKNDGKQVSAANVIVQFVPHIETNIIEDSLGSRSHQYLRRGESTYFPRWPGGRWQMALANSGGHAVIFYDKWNAGTPETGE